MKNITNIVLSFTFIFSIVIFSSFKNNPIKEDVKKEIKTEKEDGEKEEKVFSVVYEATVSAGVMFSPLEFIKVLVDTFVVVSNDNWIDVDLSVKTQNFYRIFFTHIISKNAP